MKKELTEEDLNEKRDQELEAQALEISKGIEGNPKVYHFRFLDENKEEIVFFVSEPSRMTKIRVLDLSVQGTFSACEVLLTSCLIKAHSSTRLDTDDKAYLGALLEVNKLIQMYTPAKKKN